MDFSQTSRGRSFQLARALPERTTKAQTRPEGKLSFGPRMRQEDFRSAFTAAEGWGRFTQKVASGKQSAGIEIRYGRLQLKELALDTLNGAAVTSAQVTLDGKPVSTSFKVDAERYVLTFESGVTVDTGQRLEVSLS